MAIIPGVILGSWPPEPVLLQRFFCGGGNPILMSTGNISMRGRHYLCPLPPALLLAGCAVQLSSAQPGTFSFCLCSAACRASSIACYPMECPPWHPIFTCCSTTTLCHVHLSRARVNSRQDKSYGYTARKGYLGTYCTVIKGRRKYSGATVCSSCWF